MVRKSQDETILYTAGRDRMIKAWHVSYQKKQVRLRAVFNCVIG